MSATHVNEDEIALDCNKVCKCDKPDFNDTYYNIVLKQPCVHCDICGGVP